MRALVRTLLRDSRTPLPTQIQLDHWFGSGAVPDSPPRPFAEIKFGGTFRGMGSVKRRRLEVWVHDAEGDYGIIEDEISYIKSVLDGAEHRSDGKGNEIISCSWVNDSVDLYDDGYRTFCKSTVFEIVGKDNT